MPLYLEGYAEARAEVWKMNRDQLLEFIDGLYGRENLPEDYTIEQLRHEALNQCRRDFTDTESPEYETIQFWKKISEANRKGRNP